MRVRTWLKNFVSSTFMCSLDLKYPGYHCHIDLSAEIEARSGEAEKRLSEKKGRWQGASLLATTLNPTHFTLLCSYPEYQNHFSFILAIHSTASPFLRFSASPLLRFSASPLLRFSASPLGFLSTHSIFCGSGTQGRYILK